jgi:tripartite-type tricarboxylate transporter receptor subunit TctC
MPTRRALLKTFAAGSVAAAFPIRTFAADWPQGPVRILVPFSAGGNTDGTSRLMAKHLTEKLGQPFVVENRVGAGGIVAAEAEARAKPNGYTLMMAALPQFAIVPAMRKVTYDPVKDFDPISNIASNPFCLMANKNFEPKTLKEFITYVKARPGKVAYASGGTGSLSHLTMVLLCKRAGLEMVHVPYKGGAPAVVGVIGGVVPVYFGNLSEALPHAGHDLRLLAVSGTKRVKKIPDVPTVAESGYPEFRAETWNGLVAPAHTPKPVIDLVAGEVQNALKDPDILSRMDAYGVDPIGSTPAEFAATIKADIEQWHSAIKSANLKL